MYAKVFGRLFRRVQLFRVSLRQLWTAGELFDFLRTYSELAKHAGGQTFGPAHKREQVVEFIDSPATAALDLADDSLREADHIVAQGRMAGLRTAGEAAFDDVLDQIDIDCQGPEAKIAET